MKDCGHDTLMHTAALYKNGGVMEVIERHGGSVFSSDSHGQTPLHYIQDDILVDDESDDESDEPGLISLAIDAGEYEWGRRVRHLVATRLL